MEVLGLVDRSASDAVAVAVSWVQRNGRQLLGWLGRGGGEEEAPLVLGPERDLLVCLHDVHGLKKMGASLGAAVALAVALTMLRERLKGAQVLGLRRGMALTGEINLRGEVMPVVDVGVKLTAAHQAGCTLAIIPKAMEPELVKMRDEARGAYQKWLRERVVLAADMVDVLCQAVEGG